jgi:threonine/homoserine/homoserine lactone efflux protein
MLTLHQLAVFVPAAVIMAFIPGQDVMFVLAQSTIGGARRGLIAMAGILTAFFAVHVSAAAFGLSALLLKYALLFSALKYAGAAYLVFLGIQAYLKPPQNDDVPPVRRRGAPFVQGFLTNLLNPKVAIFILAFFPQFIATAHGSVLLQVYEMGAIWGLAGVAALSLAAYAGQSLGRLRQRYRLVEQLERYVAGTILVSLGLRVALPDNH